MCNAKFNSMKYNLYWKSLRKWRNLVKKWMSITKIWVPQKNLTFRLPCWRKYHWATYIFHLFSADVREFFQLDNPRHSSINIDEEEDEVAEIVRIFPSLSHLCWYHSVNRSSYTCRLKVNVGSDPCYQNCPLDFPSNFPSTKI